jgi:hypothetical protein
LNLAAGRTVNDRSLTMAFNVRVNWTPQGAAALTLLMQNMNVVNQSDFVAKVTDLAHGWAAMKFSNFAPTWSNVNGNGVVTWSENGAPRSARIGIDFTTSNWQQYVRVTISVTGVHQLAL